MKFVPHGPYERVELDDVDRARIEEIRKERLERLQTDDINDVTRYPAGAQEVIKAIPEWRRLPETVTLTMTEDQKAYLLEIIDWVKNSYDPNYLVTGMSHSLIEPFVVLENGWKATIKASILPMILVEFSQGSEIVCVRFDAEKRWFIDATPFQTTEIERAQILSLVVKRS